MSNTARDNWVALLAGDLDAVLRLKQQAVNLFQETMATEELPEPEDLILYTALILNESKPLESEYDDYPLFWAFTSARSDYIQRGGDIASVYTLIASALAHVIALKTINPPQIVLSAMALDVFFNKPENETCLRNCMDSLMDKTEEAIPTINSALLSGTIPQDLKHGKELFYKLALEKLVKHFDDSLCSEDQALIEEFDTANSERRKELRASGIEVNKLITILRQDELDDSQRLVLFKRKIDKNQKLFDFYQCISPSTKEFFISFVLVQEIELRLRAYSNHLEQKYDVYPDIIPIAPHTLAENKWQIIQELINVINQPNKDPREILTEFKARFRENTTTLSHHQDSAGKKLILFLLTIISFGHFCTENAYESHGLFGTSKGGELVDDALKLLDETPKSGMQRKSQQLHALPLDLERDADREPLLVSSADDSDDNEIYSPCINP